MYHCNMIKWLSIKLNCNKWQSIATSDKVDYVNLEIPQYRQAFGGFSLEPGR